MTPSAMDVGTLSVYAAMRPNEMPRDFAGQFECPRCGAQGGASCRRENGSPRASNHIERCGVAKQAVVAEVVYRRQSRA